MKRYIRKDVKQCSDKNFKTKKIRKKQRRKIITILTTTGIIMQLAISQVYVQAAQYNEVKFKPWQSEKIIKETGVFKTSKKHSNTSYNESYQIDYSWFFKDNTCFNEELCHMAAIWSGLAYENYSFNGESIEEILARYMDGYKYINVQADQSDKHEAHVYIGHKLVQYNEQVKEIVMIDVRGTAGRNDAISNFDIGATDQYISEKDWTNANNAKGFDIAATRALKEINQYIETQLSHEVTEKPAVFLTGHSRGGAIANILANKMYVKSNVGYIYAYTFASPNTTTSTNATSLSPYIFNIVNEEDIVPCLPLEKWGFNRYGHTISKTLTAYQKVDFKKRLGKTYHPSTRDELEDIIQAFGSVAENRNVCYQQGDVSPVTVTKYQYQSLSAELRGYYGVMTNPRDPNKYDLYQQPMYIMTLLGIASNAGDNIAEKKKFILNNVAEEYKDAKWKFVKASPRIKDPHYLDSYILIN